MYTKVDRPMLIRDAEPRGFSWVNPTFRERTGLDAAALARRPFIDWIHDDDRAALSGLLRSPGPGWFRTRHQTRDGRGLPIEVQVKASPRGAAVLARHRHDDDGPGAYGDAFDRGTVAGTLETIARIVEDQHPGYRCSILLKDHGRFARGAGPSLPEEYNAAIIGEALGPMMGSCGTAIYWNVPVIVEDIQNDPLWRPFAELARDAGVAACWSHPFTDSEGRVLGALALYAPEPRSPTPAQLESLRTAARLTGLAVERGRVEEALREKRRRERELEEQLRQAAKMEALGVLAGGVAHDFNNLLMSISGNAELALIKLPAGHAARRMIDRIVTTSQRAGELCSQMLAYAGRGAMETRRVEVQGLLAELRDLARPALSTNTCLAYSLPEGPIYVDADEHQLLQVMLSLVTNAAEAIDHEGGRIEVSAEVLTLGRATLDAWAPEMSTTPGRYLRLRVADTGHGMDESTRRRIFDPFFTTRFPGRGLGLAAVAGIVRRHDGLIRVESEVGVGTTFDVLLPAVPPPQSEARSGGGTSIT